MFVLHLAKFIIMNKGLLALNGILGAAVIILFYLHFTSSNASNTTNTSTENNNSNNNVIPADSLNQFLALDSNIAAKPIKIAYVDSDSLDRNLKMLDDVEKVILEKEQELQQKIKDEDARIKRKYQGKLTKFEKRRKDYTMKGPTMTDAELQKEQQALQQMQQELQGADQNYQMEIMSLQSKLEQEYMVLKTQKMSEYYKKVQEFCEGIATRLGFDFIMIYQEGGAMLHANKDLDISKYVIDAINKEYDQNNIANPVQVPLAQ